MQQEITKILKEVLTEMDVVNVDPEVEISDVPEHGEYTTNIALRVTKILKKSPMTIGQEIVEQLERSGKLKKEGVEKVEVVPPGFINFTLSNETLIDRVLKTENKKGYSDSEFPGKKIMIEYTDPNPFKELHVGHLYSNAVGESLARLLTYTGNEVKRSDYFGDVGMHVAKSLWGLMEKMSDEKKTLSDIAQLPLADRVHYLGQAYAIGAAAYADKTEKGKKIQEEMKEINYLIYLSAQDYMKKQFQWHPQVDYAKYVTKSTYPLSKIAELYQSGRTWSMDYFESMFKRLGTQFDYYYPESIAGEYGAQIIKKYVGTVFEESDGAIVFRGEKYAPPARLAESKRTGRQGLHTRVFINSLGLPTYEAKEFGLAIAKYKDFKFDLCLNVTGNEIDEYFRVVLTALRKVDPELAAKIHHIGHGMVRMPQGKMSSRTGKVLTAEWFLEEVKKKVYEVLKQHGFPEADIDEVAEKETIAAIKYSFLKVALPGNITFDLNTSVSFDGDSGPYLLYTYARCRSVMAKNATGKQKAEKGKQTLNAEEHDLARLLLYFPDIVKEAGKQYAPNVLCSYLFDLAQACNLFYAKHPILGNDLRLALTEKTAETLKKGLNILGIETVERM